jgi:hypothetical protein
MTMYATVMTDARGTFVDARGTTSGIAVSTSQRRYTPSARVRRRSDLTAPRCPLVHEAKGGTETGPPT